MIIDVHCHTWDDSIINGDFVKLIEGVIKKLKCRDPKNISDGSAERLVKEMDEAGIDKTVLLALDGHFKFRSTVSYKDYNDYVAKILEHYPDKFIGFAGIDPRRGMEAIMELERCVEELGFRGVKFWTLTGFYPDDKEFYPFYKRVQELNVPILVHTGLGPQYTYLKYCQPIYVDTIAVDFPDITFIMAHMGDPFTNQALAVAAKNPNVYVDLSAWEPVLKLSPAAFVQTLYQAKMLCGIEKILFGSDWPLFTHILSQTEWVKGIKKLKIPPPLKLMGITDFTEEEKSAILGDNAAKILGL
ncbi:MAG: amidohydrolase family protein [Candidatus Hermodarchaeota archaeon]